MLNHSFLTIITETQHKGASLNYSTMFEEKRPKRLACYDRNSLKFPFALPLRWRRRPFYGQRVFRRDFFSDERSRRSGAGGRLSRIRRFPRDRQRTASGQLFIYRQRSSGRLTPDIYIQGTPALRPPPIRQCSSIRHLRKPFVHFLQYFLYWL